MHVGHGRSLSQGIVAIPLILRYPGVIPAGQVIDDNVSLLDVTSTLLDFTIGGQDEQDLPTAFAGRSLAQPMTPKEAIPSRPIRYVTFAGKKGWMPRWIASLWVNADRTPLRVGQTFGDEKSVWNPRGKSLSLFDVPNDPFEESPVVLTRKDSRYQAGVKPLSRWFDATDLSSRRIAHERARCRGAQEPRQYSLSVSELYPLERRPARSKAYSPLTNRIVSRNLTHRPCGLS